MHEVSFILHTPQLRFLFEHYIRRTTIQQQQQQLKMGFIMEFAENLILRLMEDPNERDRKAREQIYRRLDKGKKFKEMYSLPLRPYGFWTFERHNAQLFWDSQISQVQGRRDPYDDLLQEYSTVSPSK